MRLSYFLLSLFPVLACSQEWPQGNEEEAHFLRRVADFWQEGEYAIAKTQMEDFLKTHPQSAFADALSFTLGDLHLREKNPSEALRCYAQLQSAEWQEKAFFSRMQCLYEMQWYPTLADECEAYLQKEEAPEKLQATYLLAIALYHQCLNSKEGEALQKIALRAQPLFESLLHSELSNEVAQAFAHLCCILQQFPKAAQIYLDLAEKTGEEKEEMLFQAALIQAEYDKELGAATFAQIHQMGEKRKGEAAFNRFVLLHDLGRHEELAQIKNQILAEIPPEKEAAAHLFLGKSLLAIKQYAEAILELTCYIEKNSADVSSLSSLVEASLLGQDLHALDFAIAEWQKHFPQSPELPKAFFARAQVLKKNGARVEARIELEKLLKSFQDWPEKPEALFELAHLEYQDLLWAPCRARSEQFLTQFCTHELAPFAARYLLSSSAHLTDKNQFLTDIQTWGAFPGFSQEERCTWQFFLSKTEFDLGQKTAAKEHLEPLLHKTFPEKNDALLLLALCHQGDPSFYQMAEDALARGITLMEPRQVHLLLFNAYLSEQKLDEASAHLYRAFEAKAPIQSANLLWLAERYQESLDNRPDLFLAQRIAAILECVLQSHDPSEPVICQLAKNYLFLSRSTEARALLENLPEPSKEAKRLLAESYLRTGQEDKGEALLDAILQQSPNVRSPTSAAAALQSARLKLTRDRPRALSYLKDLILQKTLQNEPLHLEAALEYAEAQGTKKLSALCKIKECFENQDDLLSKDYHAARKVLSHKDQIYQAYLRWIEGEIASLEAELAPLSEEQKELQAKAKHLLLQIDQEKAPPALLERVMKRLKALENDQHP